VTQLLGSRVALAGLCRLRQPLSLAKRLVPAVCCQARSARGPYQPGQMPLAQAEWRARGASDWAQAVIEGGFTVLGPAKGQARAWDRCVFEKSQLVRSWASCQLERKSPAIARSGPALRPFEKSPPPSSSLAMCQRRQWQCLWIPGGWPPKNSIRPARPAPPQKCDLPEAGFERMWSPRRNTSGLQPEGNSPQPQQMKAKAAR